MFYEKEKPETKPKKEEIQEKPILSLHDYEFEDSDDGNDWET